MSFLSEIQRYQVAFREHWPLVVGLGFLFGWLLSFPLYGPVLIALIQGRDVNPHTLVVLFLAGHIIGLASGGVLSHFYRRVLPLLCLSCVPCLALTIVIGALQTTTWPVIFGLLGFLSGPVVIAWGAAFATSVLPNQRGRTLATGAILANVILYLLIRLGQAADITWLITIVAASIVAALLAIAYQYRNKTPRLLPEPSGKQTLSSIKPLTYWPLLPFIFGIYAVGGLMYYIVAASWTEPIHIIVGKLPHVALLLLAGTLADTQGRFFGAMLGAIAIGLGFMLSGLLTSTPHNIITHVLIIGSYAFLDTFTWVIAADLSSRRTAPLTYSVVLGINTLAILLGVLLGGQVGTLVSGFDTLAISTAGVLLFASLAFVPALNKTLRSSQVLAAPRSTSTILQFIASAGLTSRELEVTKLLLTGASTGEIQKELCIAPDTLKTHLRHIYRKIGVRNRLELIQTLLSQSSQQEQ